MDELTALEIQRSAVEIAEQSWAVNQQAPPQWRFVDGAVLFPSVVCPYCGTRMISNRIWIVHDNRCPAVYSLSSDGLKKEVAIHPHISGGGICTGDADDAFEALFGTGIEPSDTYGDTFRGYEKKAVFFEWFIDYFNHVCRSIRHFECSECNKPYHIYRRNSHPDDGRKAICRSCLSSLFLNCFGCSRYIRKTTSVNKRCRSCIMLRHGFSLCGKCSLPVGGGLRYHDVCSNAGLMGPPSDDFLLHITENTDFCRCLCGCSPGGSYCYCNHEDCRCVKY